MKKIWIGFLILLALTGCSASGPDQGTEVERSDAVTDHADTELAKVQAAQTLTKEITKYEVFPQGQDLKVFMDQNLYNYVRAFYANLIAYEHQYLTVSALPILTFEEEGKQIVIAASGYDWFQNFQNGIFYTSTGVRTVLEFQFVKQDGYYQLFQVIEPEDGVYWNESLMKMARGNQDRYNQIMDQKNDVFKEQDQRVFDLLLEEAERFGLEGYVNQEDQVYGYTEDVVKIKDWSPKLYPKLREDAIFYAHRSDYDQAQSGDLVPGLILYTDTGIAIADQYIEKE